MLQWHFSQIVRGEDWGKGDGSSLLQQELELANIMDALVVVFRFSVKLQ